MWTPSNLPGSAACGDSQAHSGRFWGSCLPMPTPLPSLGEAVGAPQNLYMVSLGEASRKQTPALPLNLPIIESSLPELRCPSTAGIPFSYFFSLMTPIPSPPGPSRHPGTAEVWAVCGPRAPAGLALIPGQHQGLHRLHPTPRTQKQACWPQSRPVRVSHAQALHAKAHPAPCLTHFEFLPRLTPVSPLGVQNILRGRGVEGQVPERPSHR